MEIVENKHIPVLLLEIEDFLKSKKKLNIFDGTLGGGGYTFSFLNLGLSVYSCDLDLEALNNFSLKIENSDFKNNFFGQQTNFLEYIKTFNDNFFDFIVLDLGFSSNQLSYSKRGFSYQNEEEVLDLRYDSRESVACWEKLKSVETVDNLGKIIYSYSGEVLSFRIARAVLDMVEKNKLITVKDMVDCVKHATPGSMLRKQNSILSRVWQSLRIWVNSEFESLKSFLPIATAKLKSEGKLAIVSFHSLEDKIVTKFMRDLAKPLELDDFGNKSKNYNLLTPKPIVPTEKEILTNPRSRSALLRVLEKK